MFNWRERLGLAEPREVQRTTSRLSTSERAAAETSQCGQSSQSSFPSNGPCFGRPVAHCQEAAELVVVPGVARGDSRPHSSRGGAGEVHPHSARATMSPSHGVIPGGEGASLGEGVSEPGFRGAEGKEGMSQHQEDRLREEHHHHMLISTAGQLLAGGVAGAVSKTCTAPLARLTILFQVQGMRDSRAVQHQASMWREMRRITKEEGVLAFWKGNTVTICHRLPYSAINFFAYESYKTMLESTVARWRGEEYPEPEQHHAVPHSMRRDVQDMAVKLVAGGSAGCTAASITYPLDLVRTRLAAQTKSRYYNGIIGTFSTIVRDEGLLGLYKGMGATLLGVGPNLAINFCVYETVKAKWIQHHPEMPAPIVSLGCGSLAGICSSTATFPLDLIRRRMQLMGAGGQGAVPKISIIQMFFRIVRKEGWTALYRGIVPEYAKVIPGVSIAFMTYEFMKRILRPRDDYDD